MRFLGTGILGGVFLLSSLAIAWGNDISLSATVDKTELTLEDSLRLSLTIEGVQNAPRPELPPLPHFRTASVGT
ncbi:MAG: hypothetical protein GWM98_08280, partial [Nitrospinaceae bacterium]|nr:protein BatD [Nitrospinaceae bacterium]NIR54495.1 protein BatD [Nitrospinaceae bacterium]NIT81728.1 protein BatD [Nitrospinaceae bacterium]NIW05587.1 hypothetical protein [Nitrospinaceae bacterium]NIX34126.1 hypothetical protein [Nitrospinaceae bacterium]